MLTWFLLPLIAGIVVANATTIPAFVLLGGLLLGMVGMIAAHRFDRNQLFALGAVCLSFSVGALRIIQVSDEAERRAAVIPTDRMIHAEVIVEEAVVLRKEWTAVAARIGQTPVRLMLQRKSESVGGDRLLGSGDVLHVRLRVKRIATTSDPFQPDFSRMQMRRGVYLQGFVRSDRWDFDSLAQPHFDLRQWAQNSRQTCYLRLKSIFISPTVQAFLGAILLGDRSELSASLRDEFSRSGLSHLLAVSGLHVGVILLFITLVLRLFERIIPISRYARGAIELVLLWGYAFLVGLSPSVIRATLMFSVFSTSRLFNRTIRPIDNLLFVLFGVLLIAPSSLFEIGFQLSYMSVFSILLLVPPIVRMLRTKYVVVNYVVQLMSVSFVAQLGTLPLVVYYFHQFPLVFLLSNLVLLPLIPFIMGGSLIVLLTVVVAPSARFLADGWGDGLAEILRFVSWSASFQPELLSTLWLSPIGVALIYLVMVLVFNALRMRRRWLIYSVLGALLVLFVVQYRLEYDRCTLTRIAFYRELGHGYCHVISQERSFLFTVDTLKVDPKQIDYLTRGIRSYKRIKSDTIIRSSFTSDVDPIRFDPPQLIVGNQRFVLKL